MQYKPETEKVAMMGNAYIPVLRPLSLTEDPQVQRTRQILMIILGVCLCLSVAALVVVIFESESGQHTENILRGAQVLTSILFYGFGLFVAHRYSEIGLRVFAWLGVIAIVMMGIRIVIILSLSIAALTYVNKVDSQSKGTMIGLSVGMFIVAIIYIAAFVLSVVIIKFTFKLARLINAKKCLIIQQI